MLFVCLLVCLHQYWPFQGSGWVDWIRRQRCHWSVRGKLLILIPHNWSAARQLDARPKRRFFVTKLWHAIWAQNRSFFTLCVKSGVKPMCKHYVANFGFFWVWLKVPSGNIPWSHYYQIEQWTFCLRFTLYFVNFCRDRPKVYFWRHLAIMLVQSRLDTKNTCFVLTVGSNGSIQWEYVGPTYIADSGYLWI